MPKKYRLLKDVENPGFRVARGAILEERGEHYQWDSWYVLAKHYVEENKVWFEEIKEKEQILVTRVKQNIPENFYGRPIEFTFSRKVTEDKIEPIIKALESTLNNEQPIEGVIGKHPCKYCGQSIDGDDETCWKNPKNHPDYKEYVREKYRDAPQQPEIQPLTGEYVTKEECERRERAAFYKGRENHPFAGWRYDTFQEYVKSIRYKQSTK